MIGSAVNHVVKYTKCVVVIVPELQAKHKQSCRRNHSKVGQESSLKLLTELQRCAAKLFVLRRIFCRRRPPAVPKVKNSK